MARNPHLRRVHLAGETMTACSKIVGGAMRVRHGRRAWEAVMPSWRCPGCTRATAARDDAIAAAEAA
jgi:hypothetical protein